MFNFLGNIVHAVAGLFQPKPQPQPNYQPINLGPAPVQRGIPVQGQMQPSAPVQRPVPPSPLHIDLNSLTNNPLRVVQQPSNAPQISGVTGPRDYQATPVPRALLNFSTTAGPKVGQGLLQLPGRIGAQLGVALSGGGTYQPTGILGTVAGTAPVHNPVTSAVGTAKDIYQNFAHPGRYGQQQLRQSGANPADVAKYGLALGLLEAGSNVTPGPKGIGSLAKGATRVGVTGAEDILKSSVRQSAKNPGIIRQSVAPVENVLAHIPGAEAFPALNRQKEFVAKTTAGQADTGLKSFYGLSGGDQQKVLLAQHTGTPVEPRLAPALQEIQANFKSLASLAEQSKVPGFSSREGYVPQYINPAVFKDGSKENLSARRVLTTRGIKDPTTGVYHQLSEAEARQALSKARSTTGSTLNPEAFDTHLQTSRTLDLPPEFWLNDKNGASIVRQYNHDAAHRIADAQVFGPGRSQIGNILDNVHAQGGDVGLAQQYIDKALENIKPNSTFAKATGRIMQAQSFRKLGKASISNITQHSNTVGLFGGRNTLEGANALRTDPEIQRLVDVSGVASPSELHQAQAGFGVNLGAKAGSLAAPGFKAAEKNLRRVSAATAIVTARKDAAIVTRGGMKAGASARRLEKLGINPQDVATRGGQLTQEELLHAAINGTELTQFLITPSRLPGGMSSTFGRLATQYKTFPYNQTRYAYGLAKEATKGNPLPLARYTAAAVPTGYAAAATRNYISNPNDPQKTDLIQALGTGGGYGIPTDIVQQSTYGRTPEQKTLNATEYATGPTGGDITKLLLGTTQLLSGKQSDREKGKATFGKFGLSFIPVVGNTAGNLAFPYKGPGSKDYKQQTDKALTGPLPQPDEKGKADAASMQSQIKSYRDNLLKSKDFQKLSRNDQNSQLLALDTRNAQLDAIKNAEDPNIAGAKYQLVNSKRLTGTNALFSQTKGQDGQTHILYREADPVTGKPGKTVKDVSLEYLQSPSDNPYVASDKEAKIADIALQFTKVRDYTSDPKQKAELTKAIASLGVPEENVTLARIKAYPADQQEKQVLRLIQQYPAEQRNHLINKMLTWDLISTTEANKMLEKGLISDQAYRSLYGIAQSESKFLSAVRGGADSGSPANSANSPLATTLQQATGISSPLSGAGSPKKAKKISLGAGKGPRGVRLSGGSTRVPRVKLSSSRSRLGTLGGKAKTLKLR